MQILPSTGKLLARQEKLRYNASDLFDPEINIRYGTRYLKDVLGSFGGRVDYALASYNAGPHRVRRWTGMDLTIPSEVFIEEIPFDETRDYVKLVLRNEMLYRRLYGGAMAAAPAE
jgi:soluble lytic murein transglycosylase